MNWNQHKHLWWAKQPERMSFAEGQPATTELKFFDIWHEIDSCKKKKMKVVWISEASKR